MYTNTKKKVQKVILRRESVIGRTIKKKSVYSVTKKKLKNTT